MDAAATIRLARPTIAATLHAPLVRVPDRTHRNSLGAGGGPSLIFVISAARVARQVRSSGRSSQMQRLSNAKLALSASAPGQRQMKQSYRRSALASSTGNSTIASQPSLEIDVEVARTSRPFRSRVT